MILYTLLFVGLLCGVGATGDYHNFVGARRHMTEEERSLVEPHVISGECLALKDAASCEFHECFNSAIQCSLGGPSYKRPICEGLDTMREQDRFTEQAESWIAGTRSCLFGNMSLMVQARPTAPCAYYEGVIKGSMMDFCSYSNGLCEGNMLADNKEPLVQAYGDKLIFLRSEVDYCLRDIQVMVDGWILENPDSDAARSINARNTRRSNVGGSRSSRPLKTGQGSDSRRPVAGARKRTFGYSDGEFW